MVKFGESFQVVISAQKVLDLGDTLEEWIVNLSQQENIDLERESINMAQKILLFVVNEPT